MKPLRNGNWRRGNRVELLVNGEEFYPRVFARIAEAKQEILIDTFILFDDKVGLQLREALIAAARRGVRVELTVDGWGSADLSADFVKPMSDVGIRFRVFDPHRRVLGVRVHWFRRLHRKLIVVDGRIAFVGGINFSLDHLQEFGPRAKQDYAVEVEGSVVGDIHRVMLETSSFKPSTPWRWRWWRTSPALLLAAATAGTADALLVTRDNRRNRRSIEHQYNLAIRSATKEIFILNAYFFPGYRILRNLRAACRRGVKVTFILQGKPDMPWVQRASYTLYDYLLDCGARIFEYCDRPMHGKVAVIDDDWATVGSSNLDPLSLFLNLEANLFVRDRAFAARVREHLAQLMRDSCAEVSARELPPTPLRRLIGFFAFVLTRRFSTWAAELPAHEAKPVLMPQGTDAGAGGKTTP